MEVNHQNFCVRAAGLLISSAHPFIAAFPDGLVSCSCCGEGLLEISVHTNTKIPTQQVFPILHSELKLQETHNYYYQVQGQMAIWKKQYCDFVCWTTKGIFVQHVEANEQCFEQILPKIFFYTYFVPELLTRKLDPELEIYKNVQHGGW